MWPIGEAGGPREHPSHTDSEATAPQLSSFYTTEEEVCHPPTMIARRGPSSWSASPSAATWSSWVPIRNAPYLSRPGVRAASPGAGS